jgi:hypothetical protein
MPPNGRPGSKSTTRRRRGLGRLLEEGGREAVDRVGGGGRGRSAAAGSTASSARSREERYMQRWTPRRPKSKWSLVNKNIALRLIAEGRMSPASPRPSRRQRRAANGTAPTPC